MVSEQPDQASFSTEVVTELIKVCRIIFQKLKLFELAYSIFLQESVSAIIGESQYAVSQVEGWSKTIAETISSSVQKLEHSGFKYIINVMLVQKTDGGIQVIQIINRISLSQFENCFAFAKLYEP